MYWKKPRINKIYEALSAIADERITMEQDKKVQKSTLLLAINSIQSNMIKNFCNNVR